MLGRYAKSALFSFRNVVALKTFQNGLKLNLKPIAYFSSLNTKLTNSVDIEHNLNNKKELMTINECINKFVRYYRNKTLLISFQDKRTGIYRFR